MLAAGQPVGPTPSRATPARSRCQATTPTGSIVRVVVQRGLDDVADARTGVLAGALDRRARGADRGRRSSPGWIAGVTLAPVERRSERQRRFVADAAHELRSPVASIRQHAEVAVAHPETTDVRELATTVAEESIRLQALVEDLLLLARLDEGACASNATRWTSTTWCWREARRLRDGIDAADRDTRCRRRGVSATVAISRGWSRNLGDNAARSRARSHRRSARGAGTARRARRRRRRAGHPRARARPGLRALRPVRRVARPCERGARALGSRSCGRSRVPTAATSR